jgi:spermidine/putrescine transport system ATP-binding protein
VEGSCERHVFATGQAPAIITLDHVEKYYGEYHALRDISAEIRQGEFFSLLGPRAAARPRFCAPSRGSRISPRAPSGSTGKDMEGVAPNKRPTNLVFQSYAIFPHLSVAQNVGFGLRKSPMSAEEKRRAVGEALEMVGLGISARARPMRCRAGSGSAWRWRAR